LSKYKFNR